jgi:hypothetical protein
MKNITLVAIDGLGTETEPYEKLCNDIIAKFPCLNINEVLFFTANRGYKNSSFNIVDLDNPLDYTDLNVLMFQDIADYSDGEYFMMIQLDGHPVNAHHWTPEFLEYDYIGAPWPAGMRWTGNSPVVGNGGFSIRSRRIYEITRHAEGYSEYHRKTINNEDVMLSVVVRSQLEERGIRFAPVELARKFSVEIPIDENHTLKNSFGFHGKSH